MNDVDAAKFTDHSARVWPILSYRDARSAMTFLRDAFGFEVGASHARANDPETIEHAEMWWPGGGGVMFGTAGKDESEFGARPPGNDAVYLVCDDPDARFARATAAGAEVVRGLVDEDYGSRGFTVRDPEGNIWSFGTYAGEPPTPARPEDPTGTFTALMTEWNKAIVANDADAIGAFAEPDWVFVGENGIFDGAQFLGSVAAGQVSHDMMESELADVRIYGDVAVVIARVRNQGEYEGNAFSLDEWSTDLFVRRGERWKCVLTHLTSAAPAASSDNSD
jgi:uncharacterized glyoxalase superfamily protein PhnB/ketosteroid isomerase-like protein